MSSSKAEVAAVADGIYRITQPLPWALDHVHCYAVADDDGWTVIDTGLGTPGTRQRWQAALAELGGAPVARVLLTHYHPDHLGASADLVELTGAAEVVQGAQDAVLAARAWGDDADQEEFERYLRQNGMPDEVARESAGEEGSVPVRLATPTHLVHDGDSVEMGGESYRVLLMPGHADGHITLYAERTGRMFGGDVLLHDITPNVGRWEDSRPDPLGDYLETLARLVEIDPAVVHPGHKRTIEEPAARARQIAAHHAERLDDHEAALGDGPATAYEVGQRVWSGQLGFHERRFALVEAIAHLVRLERLGRAREVTPGVWTRA